MKRKIESSLIEWKRNPRRKPLLMLGCRQIGKTYSIREFLSENYKSYVEINLEKESEKRKIFKDDLDANSIIDKIMIGSKVSLEPKKSAIFLDEIQASPRAYSSLKWLAEDGRFDIFASGSFLGIELHETDDNMPDEDVPISPLGYVDTLMMYPMDFEEYLWAMGVDTRLIDSVRKSIQNQSPVDPFYGKLIEDQFRRYLIVGGMPEAVKVYSETRNYNEVKRAISGILMVLSADTGKYSKRKTDKMKILKCMESIPSQLASDKRRFQFIDIEKGTGGRRRYGDALEWLITAGMAYRCYNLTDLEPPLSENLKETMFKVYLCDTGLLMGLMNDADPESIVNSDAYANHGIVMENSVAATLKKKGYQLYYYAKEGSTAEIDFVINNKGVKLIEVKSGKNRRSKSLNSMIGDKRKKRKGYKICEGNVMVDDKGAIHLPIYGANFLPDSSLSNIEPAKTTVEIPKVRTLDNY